MTGTGHPAAALIRDAAETLQERGGEMGTALAGLLRWHAALAVAGLLLPGGPETEGARS